MTVFAVLVCVVNWGQTECHWKWLALNVKRWFVWVGGFGYASGRTGLLLARWRLLYAFWCVI